MLTRQDVIFLTELPPEECDVLIATMRELHDARTKHGHFNSAHEGYAVILEEVDELKEEVWKKRQNRDRAHMARECIQIAAIAIRFVLEVCKQETHPDSQNPSVPKSTA